MRYQEAYQNIVKTAGFFEKIKRFFSLGNLGDMIAGHYYKKGDKFLRETLATYRPLWHSKNDRLRKLYDSHIGHMETVGTSYYRHNRDLAWDIQDTLQRLIEDPRKYIGNQRVNKNMRYLNNKPTMGYDQIVQIYENKYSKPIAKLKWNSPYALGRIYKHMYKMNDSLNRLSKRNPYIF